MATQPRRTVITTVRPSMPTRDHAAKATLGVATPITAVVFADGHDVIAARARWQSGNSATTRPTGTTTTPLNPTGNDHFAATIVPDAVGRHELFIDSWVDRHATWRHRLAAKRTADQDVTQELEEGARLIERELDRLDAKALTQAKLAIDALRDQTRSVDDRASAATAEPLATTLSGLNLPDETTTSGPHLVWVERPVAAVGAWYELFPRSYGGLRSTAQNELPRIAAMGFDVVYLPPIHPIGTTARKGAGNTLDAGPGDPGSPWAIGAAAGGHTAIAAELGTEKDFDFFVERAHAHHLEVALDYALQCSPDHPWVTEHPEWFSHRPDGSIRYAENPPKRYQDIYPIEFFPPDDGDRRALWAACRKILDHWIGRGVRIFRVDNPHTKPFAFWEWLIDGVRRDHPDVVLLAEAFTTPAVMHRLAEIGFGQSYTYFTWRTTKDELRAYGEELRDEADRFRPNFWPTTPDILSGPLRHGPRATFEQRAVLAATMSPSWGIYSGYELCENEPASETNEEFAHSEKYEIKHRDWDDPHSLAPLLTTLNAIRHRHPALADMSSLRFHPTTHPAHLAYTKQRDQDIVLTIVNLDPVDITEGSVWIDRDALGLRWDAPLQATDELHDRAFVWDDPEPFIRLGPESPEGPDAPVAHVIHLTQP